MAEVYKPLTRLERQDLQDGFLKYVQHRDGDYDLNREWLSHREDYFTQNELQPVRSRRKVSLSSFRRNISTISIENNLDPIMLWLLATAKANRSERYGIELSKRIRLSGNNKASRNEPLIYLTLEEFYHTRVLLDVVKIFGLDITIERPVSLINRIAISSIVYLPENLAAPLALAGEVLGVVAFTLLRDKAAELFSDEPEVVERIQALYNQILVDEIGHVAYARATNGWLGLKAAQLLQPVLVRAMLREVPEITRLFGLKAILDGVKAIDEYMLANGDEITAGLPSKPYRFIKAS